MKTPRGQADGPRGSREKEICNRPRFEDPGLDHAPAQDLHLAFVFFRDAVIFGGVIEQAPNSFEA
jgi:hypothetical protein